MRVGALYSFETLSKIAKFAKCAKFRAKLSSWREEDERRERGAPLSSSSVSVDPAVCSVLVGVALHRGSTRAVDNGHAGEKVKEDDWNVSHCR